MSRYLARTVTTSKVVVENFYESHAKSYDPTPARLPIKDASKKIAVADEGVRVDEGPFQDKSWLDRFVLKIGDTLDVCELKEISIPIVCKDKHDEYLNARKRVLDVYQGIHCNAQPTRCFYFEEQVLKVLVLLQLRVFPIQDIALVPEILGIPIKPSVIRFSKHFIPFVVHGIESLKKQLTPAVYQQLVSGIDESHYVNECKLVSHKIPEVGTSAFVSVQDGEEGEDDDNDVCEILDKESTADPAGAPGQTKEDDYLLQLQATKQDQQFDGHREGYEGAGADYSSDEMPDDVREAFDAQDCDSKGTPSNHVHFKYLTGASKHAQPQDVDTVSNNLDIQSQASTHGEVDNDKSQRSVDRAKVDSVRVYSDSFQRDLKGPSGQQYPGTGNFQDPGVVARKSFESSYFSSGQSVKKTRCQPAPSGNGTPVQSADQLPWQHEKSQSGGRSLERSPVLPPDQFEKQRVRHRSKGDGYHVSHQDLGRVRREKRSHEETENLGRKHNKPDSWKGSSRKYVN